jgi:hypothetical protein
MGTIELRRYVRLAISEMRGNARVPTQLMSPEESKKSKTKATDDDDVDEMSSCGGGAVSGYIAPLGKRKK